MEFRNLQHLITCPVCDVQYNDTNRAPVIIPCSNGHTICRYCAQKLVSHQSKMYCPLDKQPIDSKSKDMTIFYQSLDLKAFITHFNKFKFCEAHPQCLLGIICVNCRKNVCYRCEKQNHQGHVTDELEGIRFKAEETYIRLKNNIANIDKTLHQRKQCIDQRENQVLQEFEQKLNSCIDELLKRGNAAMEEIKTGFKALRKEPVFSSKTVINSNLIKWKEKAEKELMNMDTQMWKVMDDSSIPFSLFDKEEEYNKLNTEAWAKEERETFEAFKTQVNKIMFEFNEDFLKMMTNTSMGKLFIPQERKEPKKPESEETGCKFLASMEEGEENFDSNDETTDNQHIEMKDNADNKPSKNKVKRNKIKQLKNKNKA